MKRLILLFIPLLVLLTCCTRTVYIPTAQTVTRADSSSVHTADAYWHGWHTSDSIILRDSIFMMVRGDTIYTDRWHTRQVIRTITDTVLLATDRDSVRLVRDSVFIREPYPVEVVKYVEKPLTAWQQAQIWLGRILALLIILAAAIWLLRRKIKAWIGNKIHPNNSI